MRRTGLYGARVLLFALLAGLDRVTSAFRGPPSWKITFSEKELQGVTVYIMSNEFSN